MVAVKFEQNFGVWHSFMAVIPHSSNLPSNLTRFEWSHGGATPISDRFLYFRENPGYDFEMLYHIRMSCWACSRLSP